MKNISGSELFVKALKQEGVTHLFGYPGGVVIPIFDALFGETEIKVILTRHEQGAVHAADGYARSTGKTGVCLVTSGPGATNTITGLATANFDSVPLVVFTGQVARNMIGNDAFQEADIIGISRPVTKHNYLVLDRKDMGRILKEAFTLASSGRPGPVLVDLPSDISKELGDPEYPESVNIRGYNPVTEGHSVQIKKAAHTLSKSKKPLFYVGGGIHISEAADVFRKLVAKTQVPTISSLMGIGTLPGDHPRDLGMLGMHGTYTANMAVTNSDLLFAIGTRFDDRATGDLSKFAPEAEIVHIDIDPVAIARNVPVNIPIVGDAKQILEKILPLAEPPCIDPWIKQIEAWKAEQPLTVQNTENYLSPEAVIQTISEVFPDAIISTEVGQNQMWTALYYTFRKPRTFLTSGGLGTMGYGFPAAIGAKIGNPDKTVIDIAGDGSIQMNIQELATAVLQELPVIIAILNNGYLGMVRQWQELFYEHRYSSTCLRQGANCPPDCTGPNEDCKPYTPDFVKLAEAYGAIGIRVEKMEEVKPALIEAGKSKKKPVILEFIVERETNVFPMVPSGSAIDIMILGKENAE